MAVNKFKNIRHNITAAGAEVYTVPVGYSGIVLLAQVTNVTPTSAWVNMSIIAGSVETSLGYEFSIPGNDSAGMLSGKLVLEPGQKIYIAGSSDGVLQLVMSVLESQN